MLDRMPSRYPLNAPIDQENNADFLRYYELGKAHIDHETIERIVQETIRKARKRYR